LTVHDFPVGPPTEVPGLGPLDEGLTDAPPRKVYTCRDCGKELEYGGRGRPPTQCDEHKGQSSSASATPGGQPRKVTTRAAREAAELAAKYKGLQQKGGLITAVAEPYDGMVLFTSADRVWKQGEAVLASNDVLRTQLLQIKSSGSLGAFIATVIVNVFLPVAAHHGMLPKTIRGLPISEVLESLPRLMTKLEQATKEAGDKIAEEMARQEREARQRKEAKEARERTGPVGASA
jgi:hypothetical protein